MKRKGSKARTVEQIIRILRQADSGQTVAELCRVHNIAEGTFYRWKKQYGGMEVADAKRLKAFCLPKPGVPAFADTWQATPSSAHSFWAAAA